MADSFGEVELMFAAGYAQAPSRTIRIPSIYLVIYLFFIFLLIIKFQITHHYR